jgi:hypothetical protein
LIFWENNVVTLKKFQQNYKKELSIIRSKVVGPKFKVSVYVHKTVNLP